MAFASGDGAGRRHLIPGVEVGIELFERAADARGRILRVEQLQANEGASEPGHGAGYLLTFDIGRILVAADRVHERLLLRHLDKAEEAEAIRRVPLDEAEPWWRVAGNSITRAWPVGDGAGAEAGGTVREIRIQFREDAENPKVISLRYDRGDVWVGEEALHGG